MFATDIDVPDGILFYPCCGHDTTLPIIAFKSKISEFHFVDYQFIAPTPPISVLRATRAEYNRACSRNGRRTSASAPIDESKIKERPLSAEIRAKLKACAATMPHVLRINKTTQTYKRIWRTREGRKITLYAHRQDGLAMLMSLEKISIFFLCGDSLGEGGSGQEWFQETTMRVILDKLVDGGLIVSDGSGYHYNARTRSPVRNLWRDYINRGDDYSEENPQDFVYAGRQFSCLGRCGERYGPVYVWQVKRLADMED